MESSPQSFPSIFGGIGYSPSHQSRWAGYQTAGIARLTVEQDCLVLSPLWLWRTLMRMPVVHIPLDAVAMASRITFGIRFTVPGDPALDGTRFKRWYGGGRRLEELVGLLQARDITVQTMPRPERVRGFFRDFAISQRPGWIWRDRGWLGFVESAVALAMVVGALLALGFFSDLPTLMLVWFAFIMFVIVWGWFVGYRQRKKMSRQRRGHQL